MSEPEKEITIWHRLGGGASKPLKYRLVEAGDLNQQAADALVWRPIESAPRDGRSVLIYTPEHKNREVREAYWATPYECAPVEQCWWSTPYGPSGRGYMILPEHATHWMPLPQPPAQQEQQK